MAMKMLINATQEIRIALLDGQKLFDLDLGSPGKEQKRANIYKGKITRIEPSLEAAFVDYGAERHGFLPQREIVNAENLKEGSELIVQVEKEERGNKGAALTTFISLAGCYLVLMPNTPNSTGISRKIDGEDRDDLKEALSNVSIPEGMSIIARTAGIKRNVQELQWDLDFLLKQWQSILDAANNVPAPFLIYQESNIILRNLRDFIRNDLTEIIVDTSAAYNTAKEYLEKIRPDLVANLKLYEDITPLFSRYHLENQIETTLQRSISLRSGATICIDHTEALTSIDINSARANKGNDIEETALQTNLEAANEIARQLRLRDLGGLIVIDFIDMANQKNRRLVEQELAKASSIDRARVQIGSISSFGLLEMSRQRLRNSLSESSAITCPRCKGCGIINNIESLSLSILRIIEEAAMKDNTGQVRAEVPIEIATFLMNEKRSSIEGIEKRHYIHVLILPNPHIQTPDYEVQRIRIEDMPSCKNVNSFNLLNRQKTKEPIATKEPMQEIPVVQNIIPNDPAPQETTTKKPKVGLIKKLWNSIVGTDKDTQKSNTHKYKPYNRNRKYTQQRNRNNNNYYSKDRKPYDNANAKPYAEKQNHNNHNNNKRRRYNNNSSQKYRYSETSSKN